MVFRVLDASAFYAGVPFRSGDRYYTTPLVYDEICHIKKSHDAVGLLVETGRLRVMEPDVKSVERTKMTARKTGDLNHLSKQDVSVIALGLYMGGEIISDDYAVANVAGDLGIPALPIMTLGIRDLGRWISYCPGCRTTQETGVSCNACDTPLKRKLVKR